MDIEDRLKTYQAFAETSRKWTTVMDAKAAFVSALNGAVLALIWSGAKLPDDGGLVRFFAVSSSALSIVSLVAAILVVLPRITLQAIFGNNSTHRWSHRAISFYGYVADNYKSGNFHYFKAEVDGMDDNAFAMEALEQHFTISHVAQTKNRWVLRAGLLLVLAVAMAGVAVVLREYHLGS